MKIHIKYLFCCCIFLFLISCVPNSEEFFKAINNNDINLLRDYLSKGYNINNEYNGILPIQVAIQQNEFEIVKLFVEYGADPNLKSNNEDSPLLLLALKTEQYNIAKFLMEKGADVNIEFEPDLPISWKLCVEGEEDLLKIIIDNGLDLNHQRDKTGSSLLHTMINVSSIDLIGYIITEGIDLELKDKEQRTALSHAIFKRETEKALLLISNNADVNYTGHDGASIWIDIAYYLDNDAVKIADVAYKHGAKINNTGVLNGLEAAAYEGNYDLTKWLLEHGADPTIPNKDGYLPIDYAWRYWINPEGPPDEKKMMRAWEIERLFLEYGSREPIEQ